MKPNSNKVIGKTIYRVLTLHDHEAIKRAMTSMMDLIYMRQKTKNVECWKEHKVPIAFSSIYDREILVDRGRQDDELLFEGH